MATYEHGLPVGKSGHQCPLRCACCSTSLGLVSTVVRWQRMTARDVTRLWPRLAVEVHAHEICCPARQESRARAGTYRPETLSA